MDDRFTLPMYAYYTEALAITEPIAHKLTEAERTALAWTIAKHLALKGVTPPAKIRTAPLIDRPMGLRSP
jgi:hypothetical protein